MAPSASPDLDDTEFKEYNPAPYGGGYDLAQTYGDPLSPSDAICYPRSTSSSAIPPAPDESSRGFETLVPAYGQDPPSSEAIGNSPDQGSWLHGGWGDYHYPTSSIPDRGYEYGYGNSRIHGSCCYEQLFGYDGHGDGGHGYGYGNQLVYGSVYDYDKQAESVGDEEEVQGYDYEPSGAAEALPMYDSYMSMDYFGPSAEASVGWPCSFVEDGNGNGDVSDERMKREPWEETVDYLFGNPAAVDCTYESL